jgi:hypothetical protein
VDRDDRRAPNQPHPHHAVDGNLPRRPVRKGRTRRQDVGVAATPVQLTRARRFLEADNLRLERRYSHRRGERRSKWHAVLRTQRGRPSGARCPARRARSSGRVLRAPRRCECRRLRLAARRRRLCQHPTRSAACPQPHREHCSPPAPTAKRQVDVPRAMSGSAMWKRTVVPYGLESRLNPSVRASMMAVPRPLFAEDPGLARNRP